MIAAIDAFVRYDHEDDRGPVSMAFGLSRHELAEAVVTRKQEAALSLIIEVYRRSLPVANLLTTTSGLSESELDPGKLLPLQVVLETDVRDDIQRRLRRCMPLATEPSNVRKRVATSLARASEKNHASNSWPPTVRNYSDNYADTFRLKFRSVTVPVTYTM